MPTNVAPSDPALWVEEYYQPILRLAIHLTRQVPDAEDLTQQTFIRAAQSAERYDTRRPVKPWLTQILLREFLNWKRTRREVVEVRDDQLAMLELSDDAIVLLEAIHALSEPLKLTFLLVEVHQFSVQEAATALRVPAGTVKFRLHAARKKLQASLATTYPHAIVHETH